MDAIERYHYTLQQEVLSECASDEWCRLVNFMCNNNLPPDGNTPHAKLLRELGTFRHSIISNANDDDIILEDIRQQLYIYRKQVDELVCVQVPHREEPTHSEEGFFAFPHSIEEQQR